MALAIRMSRGGRKNRPYYSIVVTDSRNARDGRFIEKVGTYNPLLKKDDEARVTLNGERVTYWLSQGAQPSDRVAIFLGKAGLAPMPAQGNNPQKAQPKAKAQQMIKDKEEKAKAAAEAAAAPAPAEEAPAEEAAAETPAEEATTEAPAAEEAASEEAPAEEEAKAE